MAVNYDNDELVFLDEDSHQELHESQLRSWNILIVDDDEEIHTVTKLALSGLTVHQRSLHFLHAKSGKQAREVLDTFGRDIAIILLDVVMETDDAGLAVVEYLRQTLKLHEPRIILRTGQPGFAPEEQVIKSYDINDYKMKTELTRAKLLTTVIASIRSYQQILTINQSRLGLQKIIVASANLLEEHSVKGFCEGIVTQIGSLIGLEAEGIVCARAGSVLERDDDGVYVLGAAGDYAQFINERIEELHNDMIVKSVSRCLQLKKHIFEDGTSVLYLDSSGFEAAVYLNLSHPINELDKQLLEVFLSSISVGYENLYLFHELRNAAFRDGLTKLPNRSEFINILDTHRASKTSGKYCFALIDINQFSDINDGLGPDVGNEILISVATRLNERFGSDVKKGRIAADVFGLLGPADAVTPSQINAAFQHPFASEDHLLPLNVTVGLCELIDSEHATGTELLKRGNIALNRAKKISATNYEYFAPEIEEQTTQRLHLIRRLRSDFENRKLSLWFQPQVELASERVVGIESLLRWPVGNGNFISPSEFIPLAEYSGLIVDIGHWVLEESCRCLKALQKNGFTELRIAVNISIPQFRDPEFVNKVARLLTQYDLTSSLLELEITESVVMDEPHIVIDALRALRSMGVTIAIDDFGTGFSSMSYLQKLPLHRLKVDRTFVSDIDGDESSLIAETIVSLGNRLGLVTIAEGIEKREQASHMIKIGCHEAQGYLFGKPMPFDELVQFLDNREK